MIFNQTDYKSLSIGSNKIELPKRIRQLESFQGHIAVRIGSKKTDTEFKKEFDGGNVFILNESGIVWQYDKKTITEIWKKNEHTLCMYDGQADIWVDINKQKVVRTIWNPWGLDNPKEI